MDPITLTILTGAAATALYGIIVNSPRAYRWLKRRLFGKKILILGPHASGKTSFKNYLIHDEYADKYPTQTTLEVKDSIPVTVNKGGELKIDVAKISDVPGQLEATLHADLISEKRPQIVIVLLSFDDNNLLKWFDIFSSHFNSKLLFDSTLASGIKSFIIILNKLDLAEENICINTEKNLRDIVKKNLDTTLKFGHDKVPVVSCTLYKSKGGELSAKKVVMMMINSIKTGKPFEVRQ